MRKRILACATLGALLVAGCSTVGQPRADAGRVRSQPEGMEGHWHGSWISQKNGHRGDLRCDVTRLEEGRYRASFHATYWKILKFKQEVIMDATTRETVTGFTGETNLGWWGGGVYEYKGTATPETFRASYRSKYDHGLFEMGRPAYE